MTEEKTNRQVPFITLVGAGPGDPELLTVKAVRTIQSANVVLYDALVSQEILKLIPPNIPAWSVGKRAGAHSFKQDEINVLMVEFAMQYGHVVRLKGGDPFVFGRGHEETLYARSKGIPVDCVPGITSALAAPAAVGIPLTSRGVNESFWVVTGTTRTGALSSDLRFAAQSSATVVILMGMNKIAEIVQVFREAGKGHTPVAVIQNATLAEQRSIVTGIDALAEDIEKHQLASPAVIVVGEIVRTVSAGALRDVMMAHGI